MSLSIDIQYKTDFQLSDEERKMLIQLLEKASEKEQRYGEVAITFCGNEEIQELNRKFRGIDRPTDVLSFPMEEDDLLGDLVISIDKAKEQAAEYGHSFMRELGFLAVHGFLHLIGYDHQTAEEEREMFALQEEILSEMGLTR